MCWSLNMPVVPRRSRTLQSQEQANFDAVTGITLSSLINGLREETWMLVHCYFSKQRVLFVDAVDTWYTVRVRCLCCIFDGFSVRVLVLAT